MDKMYIAFIISSVLAVLIFRTNYTKDIKESRSKYSTGSGKKFNYVYLITDVASAIIFALIGCYLSWDSITTIASLRQYESTKFIYSIVFGVIFQQALPIIIEIAMDKINKFRPNSGNNMK